MPPRKSRNTKITYKDPESEDDLSPPPSPPSKADDDCIASSFTTQKRARTKAACASALASDEPAPDGESSVWTAGREVYNTLEIRERIFRLIDKETLAGMLRLEKAATASVAAVLYHTINVSLVSRMSRANPRRVTYCDAVRVLDQNPAPEPLKRRTTRSVRPSQQFDGQQLLKDLVPLRKKYPNLMRIVHDFPAEASSDAYTIRLDGEEVHVDLKTVFHADDDLPGLGDGSPKFPPSPEWPGIRLRHTIIFDLEPRNPRGYINSDLRVKLKMWFYGTPDIDRRLAGLRSDHYLTGIEYDGVLAFLSARQKQDCEPLTEFTIPYQHDQTMTVARLGDLLALLGPDLRVLDVDDRLVIDVEESLPTVMSLLNDRFPSLQRLSLRYTKLPLKNHSEDYEHDCRSEVAHESPRSSVGQWTGLPKLRHFELWPQTPSNALLTFASYLARLGRDDCTYAYPTWGTSLLTDHIRKHKSSRPEHAFLHVINYADLDIWSLEDLAKLPPADQGGKRRRIAWATLDQSSAALADQKRRLEQASTRQQAAMMEYEKSISDIQVGLEGAKGDPAAETELLKEKFKNVTERQAVLTTACQEMEALLQSIMERSRDLASYGEGWTKHQ